MLNVEKTKQCFVVSPIGKAGSDARINADWLLEGIIKPVLSSAAPEFEVVRADTIAAPGLIDSQIIKPLLEAELVIADLTGLNPNVFYEIGIRHVVQKPIIHMHVDGEPIPFDVSIFRSVPYSRITFQGIEQAKRDLGTVVAAVFAKGYEVENPVTRTQEKIAFRQTATPSDKVLFDGLESVSARVERLELASSVDTLPFLFQREFFDRMRGVDKFVTVRIEAPNTVSKLDFQTFLKSDVLPFFFMTSTNQGELDIEFTFKLDSGGDREKVRRVQELAKSRGYIFSATEAAA